MLTKRPDAPLRSLSKSTNCPGARQVYFRITSQTPGPGRLWFFKAITHRLEFVDLSFLKSVTHQEFFEYLLNHLSSLIFPYYFWLLFDLPLSLFPFSSAFQCLLVIVPHCVVCIESPLTLKAPAKFC